MSTVPKPKPPPVERSFRKLWDDVYEWFHDFIDLQDGSDREGTIVMIKSGKSMSGSNAWMLVCSIMIASLGLDLNSEAVIIGAMLISPLMSPILGIGLGVSINDRVTLSASIKHFAISIAIALATSTFYFWVTPLGTFTDMIEARTAPTLLDGMVAIFGGLAGIISVTRKDKSNAIPGVAIATALMPPLCVTGYGIANGNLEITYNSFYLFFLNSFFIAATSYLIIRFLRFPYKVHPNPSDARRARVVGFIISLLLIIPGVSILRGVIEDLQDRQATKAFIVDRFGIDCVDHSSFEVSPDSNLLVLQLRNRELTDSQLVNYNRLLRDSYKLVNTYLQVLPDYGGKLADLEKAVATNQFGRLEAQLNELRQQQLISKKRDSVLLSNRFVPVALDSAQLNRLSQTIRLADQFKTLDTLSFGKVMQTDLAGQQRLVPLFLAHWNNRPRGRILRRQEADLRQFLTSYFATHNLALDSFVVHSYQ